MLAGLVLAWLLLQAPAPVQVPVQVPIVEARQPTKLEVAAGMAGQHGGQCVEFVQRLYASFYTHPAFRGFAGEIEPNATEPVVGAAVLTRESAQGHVALVSAIEGDDLVLIESNYHNDEIVTVGRRLKKNDGRIKGYFVF